MTAFSNTCHSSVHWYTYLASLYDDGKSANSSPSKDGPEAEAGPILWGAGVGWWGWLCVHHKWACSELWSLSWLSSLAKESVEWWSAAMPENSDGSNVPFFTLTSSFSRAAAPCWPPFTLFHFILLFWNHTFTYGWRRQKMSNPFLIRRKQTVTKTIKKQLGYLTAWQLLSLKVWLLFLQQ